jgi:ribosome-binding factor A
MDERRTLRVSEAVREELAEIVGFEAEDPRFLGVEVLEVEVSPDGRYATIKVGVRGTEREQKTTMTAIENATPFLRHQLATRLTLRRVPELHFVQSRHADADSRVDFLLRRAKKSRGRDEKKP